MISTNKTEGTASWHLPHIGQRILKTSLAVFICLLVYLLLGYRGQNMPAEAAITAIICMQPYVKDSRTYAVNRFIGSLIGAFWGLMFLLLLTVVNATGRNLFLLYAAMALGVLLSLYSTVVIRMPDAAALSAIVFVCVVIAFPDIEDPIAQAGHRMFDVFVGTMAAILVNVFRLPRKKDRSLVFFLKTRDLCPDRFSHIPPSALYRLNYLYEDGAHICLMSEHAPAFFSLQMGGTFLNTPMIVMDGAAIYDTNEKTYLSVKTLAPTDSAHLRERLDKLGMSYFIYTVHRDRTCIFHHGNVRPEEEAILVRLRRSPYRDYLEGDLYNEAEIVYLKVIVRDEKLSELTEGLGEFLQLAGTRFVIRPQAGTPGISALYIYSRESTMEQAEARLMLMLQEIDPSLKPAPIHARAPYRSERDAIHLLQQVEKRYAPLWLKKKP